MDNNWKFWLGIARNIGAFIAGFLAIGLIPVYSSPFGGCGNNIYLSIDPHCSVWPEFVRSFLFVVIICFVSASAKLMPIIAMLVVFFVSIHGGFEDINASVGSLSNFADIINNLYIALPDLLGGIFAYLMYLGVSYQIKVRRNVNY